MVASSIHSGAGADGDMRKPQVTKARVVKLTLLDGELDELIECVAHAADRADSGSYHMAGTPKAKTLAKERAKHLYDLASRLESARTDRRR
jgi:hypothetical protein